LTSISLDAEVDTGCGPTLLNGHLLRPLGWAPQPFGQPGVERFGGLTGNFVDGTPINVQLTLQTGEEFDLTVYGSNVPIQRNLLGRDFLQRTIFAMDLQLGHFYLSSIRESRDGIFVAQSGVVF